MKRKRNLASRQRASASPNELMVSVVLLAKLVKQKVAGIESSLEQKRLTPIALVRLVLKNARTRPALIRYPERNGSVKVKNR